MKRILLWTVVCLLVVTTKIAWALSPPEEFLESLTGSMLTALKNNDEKIKQDANAILPLIEELLSPHVDYHGMARWVAGRQVWLKISDAERAAFQDEFKTLLIRTYSGALLNYDNQTIVYLPLRGDFEAKKRVQVISQVSEPGKASIEIIYRMRKKADEWLVYDIVIEGVSLLKGFQSQFEEGFKNDGVLKVIADLRTQNAKGLNSGE